jgi:hypothetical protein
VATTAPKKKPDTGFIYRPYITLPNGKVIWASTYGKRAFRIPVGDNDNAPKKSE